MPGQSVTVLGLHDGHDSGAAIIRDGAVMAAVQEERLRNIKHYSGSPTLSVSEVFHIAQISPEEVDLIAIAGLVRVHAPIKEYPWYVKLIERLSPLVASRSFTKLYVNLLHRFRNMKEIRKVLEELGISEKETVFVEHHLAHASAAYYSSPWPLEVPVLVLTADGSGDGISSTVSIGQDGNLRRISESIYYDSLGNAFYSEVTRYLGMTPWDHEYKVMGLAPYGNADICLGKVSKIIRINPKNKLVFQNTSGAYTSRIQKKLRRLLAGERFDNIAAATQSWLETLMSTWVTNAVGETNVAKVACAGGVFLNVKANKKISEIPQVEDTFFYPAAGDDGIAIGAALNGYFQFKRRDGMEPQRVPLGNVYYGPSFTDEEIESAIMIAGLSNVAEKYGDVDGVVGEKVAKGAIVGRFSGRMEFGPRALGNRSIIADCRNLSVTRKINVAIKQRDFWMPFAPTILEERMSEYLINARSAPFMILAFDSTERRSDLIAAIHPYDYSCRPQTLNGSENLGYARVVKSFEKLTGSGGILNTSFNLHGLPIVCTPGQAIWTFENSGLDGLALGNYLIMRN